MDVLYENKTNDSDRKRTMKKSRKKKTLSQHIKPIEPMDNENDIN